MDRWQRPNSSPTFEMELAKLCRLRTSDPQARPITQYPSVDLLYYTSSGHRSAPESSTRFIPVAARNVGSKRVRVSELNHVTVPSTACSVERLQLGTEKSTNTAIWNPEFYGSVIGARVYGKHSVHEPEHDPPEASDYDEENEHEELDSSHDESDPCDVLGSNVFRLILSFLDLRSLGRCLAVSTAWQLCAQDDSLWDSACKQLWDGKVHIHPTALDPATSRLRAFQISVADSKRIRIEARDLCIFVWELNFKEHTGEYWKQLDPYYRGLPLMRRIFHQDGHITDQPADQVWGGGQASSWTLRRSKSKTGPSLVQINHWPPLAISRTPAWGWKMENAWVVYTSTSEMVTSRTTENLLTTAPSGASADEEISRHLHALGQIFQSPATTFNS